MRVGGVRRHRKWVVARLNSAETLDLDADGDWRVRSWSESVNLHAPNGVDVRIEVDASGHIAAFLEGGRHRFLKPAAATPTAPVK